MKPFLILQARPNDQASDGEYNAFLKYGGLTDSDVRRIRMDSDQLPELNLDDYAAVIVGGGPWNISDAVEKKSEAQQAAEQWLADLLNQIVDIDKPYLGACYGFGALTENQSGEVAKGRYAEGLSVVDIHVNDEGKADPLLVNLPTTFKAIVGHKESCQSLPQNAVLLASSEACPNHMYRIGKNVYATQFHPELDGEGTATRIDVYRHAGYFPADEADVLKEYYLKQTLTVPMEILERFVERYRK